MTVLSFKETVLATGRSDFHETVFDGHRILMFDDIHKDFVDECRRGGGVSYNALKLAHLCVVYGILLMKDRTSKRIDVRYIHLDDDFNVPFKNVPWGRVAYDFLVTSTHNARRCIFRLMSKERSLSCEAHGFPHALLLWAYEVLPRLGMFAALPRHNMVGRIPRMLRWKVDCYYGFEAMQPLFQSVTGATPVVMLPSEAEARMLTDLGLPYSTDHGLLPSNGSKRKRKLNFSPYDDPKKKQPLKNASTPPTHMSDRVKAAQPSPDHDIPFYHHSPAASRSPGSPKVDAAVHSVSNANDTILVMNKVLRRITCMEQNRLKRQEEFEARVFDMLRTSMGVDMPPCLKRCLFCGCKNDSEGSNKENKPPINKNRLLNLVKEKVTEGASIHEFPSSSRWMNGNLCNVTAKELPVLGDHASPNGVLDFKDESDTNSFLLDFVWNPSLLKNKLDEKGESVDKGEHVEKGESVEKDVSKVTPLSKRSSLKIMPSSAPPRASTSSYRIGISVPGSAPPRRLVNDVEEVVVSIFDPNDMDYKYQETDNFVEWQRTSIAAHPNLPVTKLPTQNKVNCQWFEMLWAARGWLGDEQMDVLFNLMVYKYYVDGVNASTRDWSILEYVCWGPLTQPDYAPATEIVMPYVCGRLPLVKPMEWTRSKRIFGFGHVNGNHWVGYEINLQTQCIIVYDSLHTRMDSYQPLFENMSRNIPILCRLGRVWERNGMAEPLREYPWPILLSPVGPRQQNLCDCGIMVMKTLDCLARRVSVSLIDPGRGALFPTTVLCQVVCVRYYALMI